MLKQKSTSLIALRDLDILSRYMTVAYFFATIVLCSALIFSYFTLKGILVEQARLYEFGTLTNELRTNIRDSSLYLSDLKSAKGLPPSESRIELKIKARMNSTLEKIEHLKNNIKSQLLLLEEFSYYSDFDQVFNAPPGNIWQKLDQYIDRLTEITTDSDYGDSATDLLWLPVEATAAKHGALGQSYGSALSQLQSIISDRSDHLSQTHKSLTLFSVVVVLLELVIIFLPLRRLLEKINTKLISAHKKLYLQANYDPQTGLENTAGVIKRLQENENEDQFDRLILICIENVDSISQKVGPPVLEVFFKEFAHQLSNIDRTKQPVFRAGDNEFALLQTNKGQAETTTDVLRIQNILGSKLYIENTIVYPEIILGSADGEITAYNFRNKLIDARLSAQRYNPREAVIPKYELFMRSRMEDENQWVEKIRVGINNSEFVPFYQIKVDAKTGMACGMEALCRWKLSDGTLIQPFEFIPIAEKSGLITEITWQMLAQIARDYKEWIKSGLKPGRIAFNAAEMMMRETDFSERMAKLVKEIDTSYCPLDLEITENVAIGREGEVISDAISEVRRLGMKIALDDFGTGYASLSSIVNLDIDAIKVDRSFVKLMSTNDKSKNIVVTIVNLCQLLNKKCVVEGVETKAEWEFCRDLGCDEIQGYYFYKPAPFTEVRDNLISEQQLKKAS